MTHIKKLLAATLAATMLAGCGGSNNDPTVLPSLYAGTWSGTWNGPLSNDGGSLSLTITSDGSVGGTMGRTGGLSGPIGGVINGSGKLTATASFATSGNFIITGQVVKGASTLSGSFTYSWLGQDYTGTFSETSQSSTSTGSGAAG